MKRASFFFALALTPALFAGDPDGFLMLKQSDIAARAKATKLDANKAGADRVATWGNHNLMIIRRDGNGAAEVHDTQVDVITVVSGEGTLIVGGTVVDGKPTTPGEIRGKSITGGSSHPMMPGDVFHIPAKTPHQMMVPKGSLVLEVVKVDSK